MCRTSPTAGGSGSSKSAMPPLRWPARGRIRKPKCMTRRAFTRRPAHKGRTRSASGQPGRVGSRMAGRTSKHRHRVRAPARARMAEPRTAVVTGASRGLGFASAVRLYREGWRVVAAMREPDRGLPLLRDEVGAGGDDDRLVGVQLDLLDAGSIAAAAKAIEEAVGAPYA